ncbi:MAG: hypothetical protein Ct9H90mP15_04160 [Candidatus Neomarinimicrobiota bacterium]|nr:MAG: hypothetical protein Ct9H90mP15_04160 [Candidatus Neomarinimicrobiota bacterium]
MGKSNRNKHKTIFSSIIIAIIVAGWFLFNEQFGLGIIALCGD